MNRFNGLEEHIYLESKDIDLVIAKWKQNRELKRQHLHSTQEKVQFIQH